MNFTEEDRTCEGRIRNFTLIPEVRFKLEGKNGFLAALKDRIQKRRHAVIVVAEGAGQAIASGGPLYWRPAKQRGSSRPLIMPILISDFDGTITRYDFSSGSANAGRFPHKTILGKSLSRAK